MHKPFAARADPTEIFLSRKSQHRLTRVALLFAGLAMLARAQSEPGVLWGGADSPNMVSSAKNLPANPTGTPPAWEVPLGMHQYSIPSIDRGRIYIAASDAVVDRAGYKPSGGGLILCVEQATGNTIWRLPIPRYMAGVKPPYHFDQWKCGVCSAPVIEGDRVYVIGNRGEILCLDRLGQANGNQGPVLDELEYMGLGGVPAAKLEPTDGDIIWRYNLIQELDAVLHDVCGSTLLLAGDFLYACTSNGIDDQHAKVPRPLAPTLIVLDKITGRLVARDDEKIGQRLWHCNWSSPSFGRVAGRPMIFFGAGDGFLYAFEPPSASSGSGIQTLKKIWAYDCNPVGYRMRDGQPVPYSKHSKNSPLGPSEIIGTPVFDQGRVYVAIGQSPIHGVGQGCLSCLDAASGKKIWDSTLVDRTLATVAISEGLLYISDYSGNLHCFDANTGQRLWVHELGNKSWSASPFVADGKVYIGTEANVFWVLQAGKEKKILSRGNLKTMPITPTAADGMLYLPTQRSLAAIPGRP